jgi:hypothetical protein
MSSDEDKVHWSSIDCIAIKVVVVVKVGSRYWDQGSGIEVVVVMVVVVVVLKSP